MPSVASWIFNKLCNFLGTRPSLPNIPLTEDYLPVLEIFYACTEYEPDKRPTAAKILHLLESLLEQKDNTKGKWMLWFLFFRNNLPFKDIFSMNC